MLYTPSEASFLAGRGKGLEDNSKGSSKTNHNKTNS